MRGAARDDLGRAIIRRTRNHARAASARTQPVPPRPCTRAARSALAADQLVSAIDQPLYKRCRHRSPTEQHPPASSEPRRGSIPVAVLEQNLQVAPLGEMAAEPAAASETLVWYDRRVLAGGVIAGLGFGIGTSFGLFVEPITSALGLGREIISLAVGISMGVNGFSSIFWGNLNDRLGIFPTVTIGAIVLTFGLWLTSLASSSGLLLFSIPLSGFGDGAITPGIVLGAVGKLFTDDALRARAMGRTQALQSCGAVFVPPLIQAVIGATTHWYTAFRVVGCVAVLMIPLAWTLRPKHTPSLDTDVTKQSTFTTREIFAASWKSRSFVLTTIGFFACGFHVVFLNTHLAAHCKDKGLEDWVGRASALGLSLAASAPAGPEANGPKRSTWCSQGSTSHGASCFYCSICYQSRRHLFSSSLR